MAGQPLPLVVLISGTGSNLQALIDGQLTGRLPIDIRAVISNRAGAAGLDRARTAGIRTRILPHGDYTDREAFDGALAAEVADYAPELVVLAGFMRVLTPTFVGRFEGRLINIHPSLLPAYRGLHTHRRALADGVSEHGCSIHYVTAEMDAGPVIAQGLVAVEPGDDEARLAARVQAMEHRLYPEAVGWIAAGRVQWREGTVWFDGTPRQAPPRLAAAQAQPTGLEGA